jgi:hypothetical protein
VVIVSSVRFASWEGVAGIHEKGDGVEKKKILFLESNPDSSVILPIA